MARLDPGASARWVARRARRATAALKSEYDAGRRGDESPVEPIFPTPREQLQALQRLIAGGGGAATGSPEPVEAAGGGESADARAAPVAAVAATDDGPVGDGSAGDGSAGDGSAGDDEVQTVTSALRRVDWHQVRAATAERTGEAAQAMRSMAAQVDWGKVQPVAAQVSSALIAAVAAGRVPLGGPVGPLVAKALSDRGALAGRVGAAMQAGDDLPPDFRADVDGRPA